MKPAKSEPKRKRELRTATEYDQALVRLIREVREYCQKESWRADIEPMQKALEDLE